MLYGAILHLIAGAVAGAVFRLGTLIMLSLIVVAEATGALFALDTGSALWILSFIVVLQAGYFASSVLRFSWIGPQPLPAAKTRRTQ